MPSMLRAEIRALAHGIELADYCGDDYLAAALCRERARLHARAALEGDGAPLSWPASTKRTLCDQYRALAVDSRLAGETLAGLTRDGASPAAIADARETLREKTRRLGDLYSELTDASPEDAPCAATGACGGGTSA